MLIGVRILHLVEGARSQDVPVRVFAPEADGSGWSCRYEIGWPDSVREKKAFGVDALQALQLAQQKIGSELYTSPHHASGALVWERPHGGYGFPVPLSLRDLLVGDDIKFEG